MIPKLFNENEKFYRFLTDSGVAIEYTTRQLRRFHITSVIRKPLYLYTYTNDNGKFHASGRFITNEELIPELQSIMDDSYECHAGFRLFDTEKMEEVFPFIEKISLVYKKKSK